MGKENFTYISGVAKLTGELLIILNPLKMLYYGHEKTI
jgi:hypothetical protein